MTDLADRPGRTARAAAPAWRPRTIAQLVDDQLAALEAWHRARAAWDEAGEASRAAASSREVAMDIRRRSELRRLEHEAVMARAGSHLGDPRLCLGSDAPRAVVAHRQPWFRGKLEEALRGLGVSVVACVEDGILASAAIVVDQPDLVFVEDRLPGLSGAQVLDRARTFAPAALAAAQTEAQQAMSDLTAAGAQAVFTRRVPPADVAEQLASLLRRGAVPRG